MHDDTMHEIEFWIAINNHGDFAITVECAEEASEEITRDYTSAAVRVMHCKLCTTAENDRVTGTVRRQTARSLSPSPDQRCAARNRAAIPSPAGSDPSDVAPSNGGWRR